MWAALQWWGPAGGASSCWGPGREQLSVPGSRHPCQDLPEGPQHRQHPQEVGTQPASAPGTQGSRGADGNVCNALHYRCHWWVMEVVWWLFRHLVLLRIVTS